MSHQSDVAKALMVVLREQLEPQRCGIAIDPGTPLFDGGLGLDSFGVVELIGEIERQFAMQFLETDFREVNFTNVAALARLVELRMSTGCD